MADCTGLENRHPVRDRGFESLPLRSFPDRHGKSFHATPVPPQRDPFSRRGDQAAGSLTMLNQKCSMDLTTPMNWSRSTGLVT